MQPCTILNDLRDLFEGRTGRCGWAGDAGAETIRWWSRELGKTEQEVLDAIAVEVAHGFLHSKYEWEFADWVANCALFTGMTDFELDGGHLEDPDPWWGVYLAFDNSELADSPKESATEGLLALDLPDIA